MIKIPDSDLIVKVLCGTAIMLLFVEFVFGLLR